MRFAKNRIVVALIIIHLCLSSSLAAQHTQITPIDSLDFVIYGGQNTYSLSETLYASKHLSKSSMPFEEYRDALDDMKMVFVLYDGSPEAYMILANAMERQNIKRFRMVDYLQMISWSLFHSLDNEWRVLSYREKICVSNNGDNVVEIVYNTRTGEWRSQNIFGFDLTRYRAVVLTPDNFITLIENSAIQYFSNIFYEEAKSLLLCSTTFSLSEAVSRISIVEKDRTYPLQKTLTLSNWYFYSQPESNRSYAALVLQSDNHEDKKVYAIMELNEPVKEENVIVDMNADGLITISVSNSNGELVFKEFLHCLPYYASYE